MRAVRSHLSRHRFRTSGNRADPQLQSMSSGEFSNDVQSTSSDASPSLSNTSQLYVKVSHARELMAMDSNGKSDPFCVIHVGKMTHKTSTKMKTLEPVWNETFTFRSKDVTAADGIIRFELFDKDQWTADDFLGRAEINVHEILTEPGQTEPMELKLTPNRWKIHSMLSSRHHNKSMGFVNIVLWWEQSEEVSEDMTCRTFRIPHGHIDIARAMMIENFMQKLSVDARA